MRRIRIKALANLKTDELIELLAKQHQPPERAFIPEFRCGTGYSRESRADAIAMELWPSNGLALTGFELKVSRADWLRELKNPYKAEPIKQFCDYWYVVCADSSIVKYLHELPHGWGLIFAEDTPDGKRLHTMVEALKLDPIPYDKALIAALMRRATRVDGLAHIVPPNKDWAPKAA